MQEACIAHQNVVNGSECLSNEPMHFMTWETADLSNPKLYNTYHTACQGSQLESIIVIVKHARMHTQYSHYYAHTLIHIIIIIIQLATH